MSKIKQLGFYLDINSCIGCKACVIACKDKNDLPVDVNWRRVVEYTGGSWQNIGSEMVPVGIFAYYLTLSCQHCEDPPCLPVCPTKAISKASDGVVHVDPVKCMGCQYCSWICPYGAPQFGDQGESMSKCDLCEDLRVLDQYPACVDACPLRALDWGDMDELRAKYGNPDKVKPLSYSFDTKPSMIITAHRHSRNSGEMNGHIANLSGTVQSGNKIIGPNSQKKK